MQVPEHKKVLKIFCHAVCRDVPHSVSALSECLNRCGATVAPSSRITLTVRIVGENNGGCWEIRFKPAMYGEMVKMSDPETVESGVGVPNHPAQRRNAWEEC